MQRRGSGVIIHTAARQGVDPIAGTAAYGVTKSHPCSLDAHTRRRAALLGNPGQRCPPQVMATKKNKGLFPPDMLVGAVEPEKILPPFIVFLASDADTPVNGAVVPAYGG